MARRAGLPRARRWRTGVGETQIGAAPLPAQVVHARADTPAPLAPLAHGDGNVEEFPVRDEKQIDAAAGAEIVHRNRRAAAPDALRGKLDICGVNVGGCHEGQSVSLAAAPNLGRGL